MEFHVFCTSTLVIDKRVWTAFLSGLSLQQAISHIQKDTKFTLQQVTQVVLTQYRNFEMLEGFLNHPRVLNTQMIFSLNKTTKVSLIQSFYGLDSRVVRELLGKKLSHRIRKDLDLVAAKTSTSVLGCRRMFDNLKRVSKKVEDAQTNDIVGVIMNNFLLKRELASQYLHIIFLNHYRIDTTKRKLVLIKFQDYEYVASVFLQYFSGTANPLEELDPSISEDSRSLKTIIFNHKDVLEKFKAAVVENLVNGGHLALSEKISFNGFKILLRNILSIGSSIANSKDFK